MKKTITIILALAIVLATLAACGGNLTKPANGTYKSDEGFASQTWTFSGTNKITLTMGGLISTSGTYQINGSELTVTTEGLFGSTSGYTITEITNKSFFIDGTKFIKQ